jgi:hypothetical protein
MNRSHRDDLRPLVPPGLHAQDNAPRAGRRIHRRQLAIATPVAALAAIAIAVPIALSGTSASSSVQHIRPATQIPSASSLPPPSPSPTSTSTSTSSLASSTAPATTSSTAAALPRPATPPLRVSPALLNATPTVDLSADGDAPPCAGCLLRYSVHGLSTDGAPSRFDVWGPSNRAGVWMELRDVSSRRILWSRQLVDVSAPPVLETQPLASVSLADRADHVFVSTTTAVLTSISAFDVHSHAVVGFHDRDTGQGASDWTSNDSYAYAEDVDRDGVDEVAVVNLDAVTAKSADYSRATAAKLRTQAEIRYYRFVGSVVVAFIPQMDFIDAERPIEGTPVGTFVQLPPPVPFLAPDGSTISPRILEGGSERGVVITVKAGPNGAWLDPDEFLITGGPDFQHPPCALSSGVISTNGSLAPGASAEVTCVFAPSVAKGASGYIDYAPYGQTLVEWLTVVAQ